MKNYWLERREEKALTMEKKIEDMLNAHVIWLDCPYVGSQTDEWTTQITTDHIVVADHIPTTITINNLPDTIQVNWNVPPCVECTITISGPTAEDIALFEKELEAEYEKIMAQEESGWTLDL